MMLLRSVIPESEQIVAPKPTSLAGLAIVWPRLAQHVNDGKREAGPCHQDGKARTTGLAGQPAARAKR
jgi:hypothetical protein